MFKNASRLKNVNFISMDFKWKSEIEKRLNVKSTQKK